MGVSIEPSAENRFGLGLYASDDALFRAHFENLPGPAYIWRRRGEDFELIAYNRAAASLWYSRVEKLVGMLISDMRRDNEHDLRPDLDRSMRDGVVIEREVERRYLGDSEVRRVAVTLVPLSSEHAVMHTDDITERRRMEAALRESESKYRMIVDLSHEGVVAVDGASCITYANQRAAEMFGYEPGEVIGRNAFEFIDESLHEEARRFRDRRRAGIKEQIDFRLKHRNGSDIWVILSASPIADSRGEVVGAIYMIADVTARRQAEQALRESEMRMRALLDANPDLILRVTRDGLHLDAHSIDARPDLPWAPHEFIGRHVSEFLPADLAREHARRRERALATGEIERWEYVHHVNGTDLYVEARFAKAGDDEVVVAVRDNTARVRLEREVVASGERERARIGHDLHDGLAQLLIGVKLLLEALREKAAPVAPRLGADADRAVKLVAEAICLTSELAQGLSPIRKGGGLADALRELAARSSAILGARCELVSCARLALDEEAATHLYRIAQEALTNAVKHGKATHVTIACEKKRDRLELRVEDDGYGIAECAAEKAGMGLHIMRYRARSLGGDVTIAPRAGGGTVVTCSCPWPGGASEGAPTA